MTSHFYDTEIGARFPFVIECCKNLWCLDCDFVVGSDGFPDMIAIYERSGHNQSRAQTTTPVCSAVETIGPKGYAGPSSFLDRERRHAQAMTEDVWELKCPVCGLQGDVIESRFYRIVIAHYQGKCPQHKNDRHRYRATLAEVISDRNLDAMLERYRDAAR